MDDNKCCICGANYGGYGNNAEPVASGRCCNDCNAEVIIPARISMMFDAESYVFDSEEDIILAQMYEIEDMENPSELDLKNYRNLEIKYDELTRMDAEDMQPLFDDLKKQATKFTGMTILFTGIAAIGGYLIGRNRA